MEPIRNTGARRWFDLALLCSACFMVILDVATVNVALPSIRRAQYEGDFDGV